MAVLGTRWRRCLQLQQGLRSSSADAGSDGLWALLRKSRLGSWFGNLLSDYAEACKDVVAGVKERPGRAALYMSLLAGAGLCAHSAPGPGSFETCLLEASGTLLLLSPWIRNSVSDGHVQQLLRLRDQGRLRYWNLVCCSLVYETLYDPDCDLYEAQCRHLRPRWSHFSSRILDVGFLGRWWLLHAKMRDFDINEEEFKYLPVHLRTFSPRDLHSDRNERLFQEKYQAVPLPEGQLEAEARP